jgi:ribonuclease HII
LHTGTASLSAFARHAGCPGVAASSVVARVVAALTAGSATVYRSVGARIVGIPRTTSARGHVRRGVHATAATFARFSASAAFAAAQDAAEASPVSSGVVAADVVIQVELTSSAGHESDAESKTNLEHTELHGLERCARHLPSQFPNFHRTGRNFSRVKSCTHATDFPIVGFLTLTPWVTAEARVSLPRIVTHIYRIGADENGLGARLGPLVVTAVLARVSEEGSLAIGSRLPESIQQDLGDSKQLVSHADFRLGEAWARALCGGAASSPAELFSQLSLEGASLLRQPCPEQGILQCWSESGETFDAPNELVERLNGHRAALESRGVEIVAVKTSVICTKVLNAARDQGKNRFVSDLHAMERLVLELRKAAGQDVHAVCGKVGGMSEYSMFFGPLSYYLHAILDQGAAQSGYRFPGVGELYFVRDADAHDVLVMLASLVGKWVRELLMARVARHYQPDAPPAERPSGYHDPLTEKFVAASALTRKRRKIPLTCFERARDQNE